MSSFSFTFSTPTNPWTVTHDLNDSFVFWVIYDDDGEAILPSSAVATSADVFTFTFDTAITGAGTIFSVSDLVTTATGPSFTDLQTVKNCLGLAANDSTQDEQIARLIAGTSQNMKNYMRRNIVETTHTAEVHNGNNQPDLVLQNFPVVAASGVDLTLDGTAQSASNFVVDYDAGIVQFKDGLTFTKGVGNVSVDYVSGSDSGVPGDLNMSTVKQVMYELRLKGDKNAISLARSRIDGVVEDVFITSEWAQGVEPLLQRYQRRSL